MDPITRARRNFKNKSTFPPSSLAQKATEKKKNGTFRDLFSQFDKQLRLPCVSLWAIFPARRQIKIPKLMLPGGRRWHCSWSWQDSGSGMAMGINSTSSCSPFACYSWPRHVQLVVCMQTMLWRHRETLISLHINCDTCCGALNAKTAIHQDTRTLVHARTYFKSDSKARGYLCTGVSISWDFH